MFLVLLPVELSILVSQRSVQLRVADGFETIRGGTHFFSLTSESGHIEFDASRQHHISLLDDDMFTSL